VIYIDTSVVLAQLLSEDRRAVSHLWQQPMISSRLLEYETWTRVNGRGLSQSHGQSTRELLDRISFLELSPLVLGRALEPFPTTVRTLDALHLASMEYLRGRRVDLALASFDGRLSEAARRMGIPIEAIE
jgi:uncharacterized protein